MVGIVDLGVIQAKQLRQLPSAAHARMPAAPVQRRCGQPGELFIGYGGGVRLIAAVDPFRRRGQRPVRIPVMQMQEKVFPTKAVQKIHCRLIHRGARKALEIFRTAAVGGVDHMGKSIVKPWRRMPPERRNRRRVHALPGQYTGQGRFRRRGHGKCSRTVGLHAVDHAEAPGKQRCAGRHAGRVGSIRPGKTHPVRRQRVDVRRRPPIPAAGQMVRPQRVDIKINDLHRTSLTKCLRPCSYRAQIISCVKKAFSAVTYMGASPSRL